jgi:O-antigen ligase
VTESGPSKGIVLAAIIVAAVVLAAFAYFRPGYFYSQTYLGGLLLLEVLAAAVAMYRRVFFPFVVLSFLLAGVDLPLSSIWTVARWPVLGAGAAVGSLIVLKQRGHRFGMFHVVAFLAVLAALASAAVSRFTNLSSLKVLSLFLLFLYGATGARLAVSGRENRFFSGLLLGCEILVAAIGASYLLGVEILGNPNSLGAVMSVAVAPILLWGTLLPQEQFTRRRRLFFYGIAMYLVFASHARAAMLSAFLSCGLLCLALRRYRMLGQGVVILAIVAASSAIIQPEEFSKTVSAITASVVYKGKDPAAGMLASRSSPWQETIDSIRDHFWFGTGFGTSDTGQDATEDVGKFSSTSAASTEHGSSYLAIASWVGMMGVLPFFLLVAALLGKIVQTVVWMVKTGEPAHPAVPLAMVTLAGIIHATFEDWMFAPGYYLCVFFWSMAFILVDQAKSLTLSDLLWAFSWRVRARQEWQELAPTR